ncbi:MAG: hypothetical protein J2P17_03455 [Mycobacterium sp.]|nr:hypothetical protein [Mycobacterium sp.]
MHQLTTCIDAVVSTIGIDSSEAELRLTELEKFLRVATECGESLRPSQWVDEAWHVLIKDDETYRSFLSLHGLPYVHHVPDEPQGERSESAAQYARTTALIKQRYGSLNDYAWATNGSADCDSGSKCVTPCRSVQHEC